MTNRKGLSIRHYNRIHIASGHGMQDSSLQRSQIDGLLLVQYILPCERYSFDFTYPRGCPAMCDVSRSVASQMAEHMGKSWWRARFAASSWESDCCGPYL